MNESGIVTTKINEYMKRLSDFGADYYRPLDSRLNNAIIYSLLEFGLLTLNQDILVKFLKNKDSELSKLITDVINLS